jgi:hypothetical protein
MGILTQQVIAGLHQGASEGELHEHLRKAADLLVKTANPNYRSGYDDIDTEQVSQVEGEQLKQAVVMIIESSHDPTILTSAFFVLGKSYDAAFKEVYLEHLHASLSRLKQYNGLVFQLLIALDNLREDIFERDEHGQSSQSVLDIEKNVRQAQNYLMRHDIVVPW